MEGKELLKDGYMRIRELVDMSVNGLGAEGLSYRPEPGANSIAWLTWHLTRGQDRQVSEIAGGEQTWVTGRWHEKFGMEPNLQHDGRGDGPDEVAAIRPDGELLVAHHHAVSDRTFEYLDTVDADELDRIIDRSYDPPVSVGVRLISIISDNIQHAGQARYLRGIVDRIL